MSEGRRPNPARSGDPRKRARHLAEQRPVPVTVLNGFLGSGKTTLLQSLLVQAWRRSPRLRPGVIVNDMSSLDVDGIVVEETEVVSRERGSFASISGGSVHSAALLPALIEAADEMVQRIEPDHLFIETSGSTRPWPLIKAIARHRRLELHGFLSLVDAAMLRDDFDCGSGLAARIGRQFESGALGIEMLIGEQVMFASDVYLTKIDKLTPEQVRRTARELHRLNPGAGVVGLHYGNLRLDDVLRKRPYDRSRVAGLGREIEERDAAHPETGNLVSLVLDTPRPFHPIRLWEAYTTALPQTLYRSKGMAWIPSRDDKVLLWNQAGGGVDLGFFGYWKAGVLEHDEGRLLPHEIDALEREVAAIDPVFGDRRTSITLLGEEADARAFLALLESCLCTDDEVLAWRYGEEFEDPWPQRTVAIDGLGAG
ncbi:GTP-binding protein [Gulosibacter sp. 10]|uniref:CobW family GTP-binding protein n=1 Tax=Gulosibacter sp. 10 TaxID=1255570 RepID=UPI00097EFEE8|nr:GTP-binding protein [Gulosibacter sp. 10]SJM68285.1 Putative metal chaperone, involved in Zn homeostasis, GTPase of COG0523 family [Gulosibacter sp. 10]